MILFLALLALALAIAGFTAFVIFWPLMLVHLRDRHPGMLDAYGPLAFASPGAWAWLLRGAYRGVGDRNLDGLAAPARVALMTIIAGLVMSGLLYLASLVVA
ncbi:hypothetical protein LY625_01385 [Lysobacter sp. GX 14042]|uniref:hypothetical protein n=1 Tax=Lysobacter sp. GX 14042 TaxID=2907155 RepID=UPI001F4044C5|nr:hypothetical protein [Lysobacter sp. GX 14042]